MILCRSYSLQRRLKINVGVVIFCRGYVILVAPCKPHAAFRWQASLLSPIISPHMPTSNMGLNIVGRPVGDGVGFGVCGAWFMYVSQMNGSLAQLRQSRPVMIGRVVFETYSQVSCESHCRDPACFEPHIKIFVLAFLAVPLGAILGVVATSYSGYRSAIYLCIIYALLSKCDPEDKWPTPQMSCIY